MAAPPVLPAELHSEAHPEPPPGQPISPQSTAALLAAFDWQADFCQAEAPFTARLLRRSRAWLDGGTSSHNPAGDGSSNNGAAAAAAAAVAALSPQPHAGAVPLRWAAGLHWLALQGLAPWATLWPPAGGTASAALDAASAAKPGGVLGGGLDCDSESSLDAALDAALDFAIPLAWQTQRATLERALASPPQTNEVQRSAALLPGLLWVADTTGLPLALLEIGASAGLNLWCDRYRYECRPGTARQSMPQPPPQPACVPTQQAAHASPAEPWAWGDTSAPVVLRPQWTGPPPWAGAAPPRLEVRQRAGCDAHPVDLQQPAEALRLASYVWSEQRERMARLQAAQAAVGAWMAASGVAVQALPAGTFVQRELAAARPGLATVLMHSIVWQYIAADEQRAIEQTVDAAAQRATTAAPLAWLRFERDGPTSDIALRCRLWPGNSEHLLARCHPHGQHITWLAGA